MMTTLCKNDTLLFLGDSITAAVIDSMLRIWEKDFPPLWQPI